MSKVRSVIDPVNCLVKEGEMYPGLFRSYCAVRQFVNPILKGMGIAIDKNNMLIDKQFTVACTLVDRYAEAALYDYFKHTNWNNGWRTLFEFDEDGSITVGNDVMGKQLKKRAKKLVFAMTA